MSSDKTTLACCRMQRWLLNFPGTISLPDPLERMGQELRLGITDAVTGIAAKQVLILMTFGLYDMAGNLWEIVSDYWTPRYDRRTTVDPIGPEKGQGCVTRGGNWGGDNQQVRSANRTRAAETTVQSVSRVVRSPERLGSHRD